MPIRARSSGHNFNRKLESNETRVLALRAMRMAANTVSKADGEMASEMPETWRIFAALMVSANLPLSQAGIIWLAAEPARR